MKNQLALINMETFFSAPRPKKISQDNAQQLTDTVRSYGSLMLRC